MMKDYRAGQTSKGVNNFLLITAHNNNVRKTRSDLRPFPSSVIGVKTFHDINGSGLVSTLCCGARKIHVKTFKDRTSQVVEET